MTEPGNTDDPQALPEGTSPDSASGDAVTEAAELKAFQAVLTRALRPVEASQGFTDAVLRRAGVPAVEFAGSRQSASGASSRSVFGRLFRWPPVLLEGWGAGALAAAALAIAVFAGQQTHLRQEHELAVRRASANQQFEASVRILDRTLEQTREQLRQAGVAGIQ